VVPKVTLTVGGCGKRRGLGWFEIGGQPKKFTISIIGWGFIFFNFWSLGFMGLGEAFHLMLLMLYKWEGSHICPSFFNLISF
jgi:hypothetical protein